MISRQDKREAMQMVEQLRKNPPKVLPKHMAEAKGLLERHKEFEASKDRSIANERQALAKDVAGFVYNQAHGVVMVGGGQDIEIKRKLCSFCGEHDSSMYNMNDGQWYCSEHRWFGNLTTEEQEKERNLCLSTKVKK